MKPVKILQASAGSGKTFSLAAHYLTLLFTGENKYREILAVTFTNKATEEMKTRILEVLKGLARGEANVEGYRHIILSNLPTLNTETLQQKADSIYRKILHDYSRFAVSTIDGFVQKVIRGFAFELGLSADYALEMNIEKVKDALLEKLDESLTHNKQILEWVISLAMEKINSNKSWNYRTELKSIIGELFKEAYQPFEEALFALKDEDTDALFRNYNNLTKQTISQYEEQTEAQVEQAMQIFNSHNVSTSDLVGGSRSWLCKLPALKNDDDEKAAKIFALIDDPESWFKANKSNFALYEQLNPLLKNIRDFRSEHLPQYRLAQAFNQNLYYLRLMQEVAGLLVEYRNENGNLLISDAQKLVTGITDDAGDNPSFIWEKVGSRYRHFLFDEFQDTSIRQWKSFRSLLSNALSTASGKYIDHLIVGDAKQSIYRWRSGDWNILHRNAKTDIGAFYVKDEELEENYRSTKNIIAFNNALYNSIPKLLQNDINEKVNDAPEYLHHWWHENNFNTIIEQVYKGVAQKAPESAKEGGIVKVQCFTGDGSQRYTETIFREDALEVITTQINDLLKQHQYQLNEIAILVRSNVEAACCVDYLMAKGIPVISGDALLIANNPAIDLIINTLRVFIGLVEQTALYKANCIALYHEIHGKQIENPSVFIKLDKTPLLALQQILPLSLCTQWQDWIQLPLAELIENIFEAYSLHQLTEHVPYLLAFRDLVSRATRMGENGILAFLEWWEEEGALKALPSPEGADAVQIITIHKSKGLAFRAVFIPFCIWDLKTMPNSILWVSSPIAPYHQLGSIPLRFNSKLAGSSVASAYFEELLYGNMDSLNMLYVATTRAKDFLYIATMPQPKSGGLSTIGNLINMAMPEFDTSFAENNIYEHGSFLKSHNQIDQRSLIHIGHYPVSGRLSQLYEADDEQHILHRLNSERAGEYGSLAHEVLAKVSNEIELDNYLKNALNAGLISNDQSLKLKDAVLKVLNDEQIKTLFAKASNSFIEQNIIDSDGNMQRPDRILMNDDEVVLLDYKFTLQQSPSHEQQLIRYKILLQQMGYQNVKAYLYYQKTATLKAVAAA